nr:LuxR C-terminal-related transcriptional regulator [Roseburia sp. 1XD42-34]
MPKEIATAIAHQLQKGDEKQRLHSKLLEKDIDLTWRELDIVYLLYQRKKNQEIAKILHLKEKTVRDYVSITYKKLGVNKRLLVINLLENLMGKDNYPSAKSLDKDCP